MRFKRINEADEEILDVNEQEVELPDKGEVVEVSDSDDKEKAKREKLVAKNMKLLNQSVVDFMKQIQEEIDSAELEADVLDDDNTVAVSNRDQLYNELDSTLRAAITRNSSGVNTGAAVIIWGDPGTGKTTRVKSWAVGERDRLPLNFLKKRCNLVVFKGDDFDEVTLRGVMAKNDKNPETYVRLTGTDFDRLDRPNSVLYIDEVNRTKPSAIDGLLKLINEKEVIDNRTPNRTRHLNNLLMTVCTANFEDSSRGLDVTTHKLSAAMINRLKQIVVVFDPQQWLNGYFKQEVLDSIKNILTKEYNADAENIFEMGLTPDQMAQAAAEWVGRFNIAKTLIENGFVPNDTSEVVAERTSDQLAFTSPRSFTDLLLECNGTKADFLSKWNQFCNNSAYKEVEGLLRDYTDDESLKANRALDYDSKSILNKKTKLNAKEKMIQRKKDLYANADRQD